MTLLTIVFMGVVVIIQPNHDEHCSVMKTWYWPIMPTVCLPTADRLCITQNKDRLTFFVSHTADVAPSTPMVSRRLH